MELREKILLGTLQAFNKKGLKFTMDDICGILGISKKPFIRYLGIRKNCFWQW